MMNPPPSFQADYVIIGAGSAGAALAYRLSEDGKYSVLVLEYGGSDQGPFIQMPAALSYPMNMRRYDWGYKTTAQPHLGGRELVAPRGKVLGGSSSVNGMVYVRGNAGDFDEWARQGAAGWGYKDILPYFIRMENWHGWDNKGGDNKGDENLTRWRGNNGPLHISRGKLQNPLYHAFIKAGQQAGYPFTPDYNGKQQEGFGEMEQTIWRGRRWSTANAYLRPALKRKNCDSLRCLVTKIRIDQGRAIGVEALQGNHSIFIKANKEVILSASAFNSPKLLMLSGIGAGQHLQDHGIPVTLDRQGVGRNLQDHLELYIQQACTQPITLYKYFNVFGKAWTGLRWLLTKGGLGASNHFEAAAFLRSSPSIPYPDIQYHFLPLMVRYDGKSPAGGHGFQAHVGPMRSKSRGKVMLSSPDPRASPLIDFNYMAHDQDWVDFRHCIRLTRNIFNQPAFDPFRGQEIQPGADVASDAALDEFIRDHAESAYHPCGTVRMGDKDDKMAVIDPYCRVIGMEGLRVVDSSIFPTIPNGNLNGPSIMVGEKASDIILGKSPLTTDLCN